MNNTVEYLDVIKGKHSFERTGSGARPNVILISTDMVPPEFYDSMPGRVPVHTPNLDRLREESAWFRRAFATAPLCSPSRAAYLTGRHSYITTNSERAHDGHAIHLREDDPIFPEYLRASGYHTRHVGKSHVGTGKFLDAFGENDSPWDRWSPPWHEDDAYVVYLREQGFERFTFDREIVGRDTTGAPGGNHYGGWIASQGGRPFPRKATYPFYLVEQAKRSLAARPRRVGTQDTAKDAGRRASPEPSKAADVRHGAPLYFQLDFFAPHQPFAIPGDMGDREVEIRRQLELPQSYHAVLERDFQPDERQPRIYGMYRRNWGLQDPATAKDYIVANILQWELVDAAVGDFLNYLREEGLYESSWVIFIADHGEMNVESALIDKGAYLNPRVLRVPLYVKPASEETRLSPGIVDEPVSLLDLAPTISSIAGIRPHERFDGLSLLQSLPAAERLDTAPILFEVWSHVMPNPCVGCVFAVDTGRPGTGTAWSGTAAELYSITYNATDATDELYNFCEEGGLVNLYGDANYFDVFEQGLLALHRHLRSDRRFSSYADFLELEYPHLAQRAGDRQKFM